jgi:hypothetical protein
MEKPKNIILVKNYFGASMKEMKALPKEDRDELGKLCSEYWDAHPETHAEDFPSGKAK